MFSNEDLLRLRIDFHGSDSEVKVENNELTARNIKVRNSNDALRLQESQTEKATRAKGGKSVVRTTIRSLLPLYPSTAYYPIPYTLH